MVNKRVIGVCAQCGTVLVLAVWPIVYGRGPAKEPLIFRARRSGRRRLERPLKAAARNLARSGMSIDPRAETRVTTDGDPLGVGDILRGGCDCGLHYERSARTLRRLAMRATAGNDHRFRITAS